MNSRRPRSCSNAATPNVVPSHPHFIHTLVHVICWIRCQMSYSRRSLKQQARLMGFVSLCLAKSSTKFFRNTVLWMTVHCGSVGYLLGGKHMNCFHGSILAGCRRRSSSVQHATSTGLATKSSGTSCAPEGCCQSWTLQYLSSKKAEGWNGY